MSTDQPPPPAAVLETSLYLSAADSERVESFYLDLLGLREVSRWPGGVALRVGAGLLLLFELERLAERSGPIAAHGAVGPGHLCLLVDAGTGYDSWRERIAAAGVEITHEHEWEGGVRSFYFADPAGNLIEIAAGDLWPR